MNKVILFCYGLYCAGGIESFNFYLAKEFKDNPNCEIELWYSNGDPGQIDLMSNYVKCVRWDGNSPIVCDTFIFPSRDILRIIDKVIAKNIISVFHMARNTVWNTIIHPRVTKYVAVSQAGARLWNKIHNTNCQCYYPIICLDNYEKPKKLNDGVLKLVTVSRLDTPDKGAARMKKIADRLDALGIKYVWDIYGINNKLLNNKGFNYHGVILEKDKLFNAELEHDFLVQLSDDEGFCITVGEALCLGVPVVVTPYSVTPEIGLTNDNSIICNFDCSNIDEVIYKMVNNKFEFNYSMPVAGRWEEILCTK